ncbi:BCCT family transporter [Gordonia crocea]|uniref:BCCT family transporter n=1 Tax=Gordonia crocea TaxID=589162 RepID=A0A7I9UUZ6_9ACTN|nr:BCCT family transporter [Gordonia crocea]GED97024.1 BCCT family transporter [Gordonia crocea]
METDPIRNEVNRPRADRPRLDIAVFGGTAAIVLAFVVWGIAAPHSMRETTSTAMRWVTANLGWLYLVSASGFVVFALVIAFTRYGRIPLGRDGEAPEYRTISWIAMMFAAGMGIGLMFFGAYEPLLHYLQEPPGAALKAPPGTQANHLPTAMATTMFHWGFHPWAMYAVVGMVLGYSTYRKGRGQLLSAAFAPLLGTRRAHGPVGKVIDGLAIFATLFGTVASLGLGALQIGSGLESVRWVSSPSKMLLVAIIAVLTAAFVASAVSGVAKGIQWLSNTNMVLALVLAVFVFVVGPTVFVLNVMPTALGAYLDQIMAMAARSSATVDAAGEKWLADQTIFYWAWWVSWTPFVGLFLAKISRGRTIREFVVGVMVVPTSVSLVWFAIFGGTAIRQQNEGAGYRVGTSGDEEDLLFEVLRHLPWTPIASLLVMALVAIFFVSGADSASLVMGTLSQRGAHEPSRWVTVFWGVLTGGVAVLLLVVGGGEDGTDGLTGVKQMAILAALPFVVVMIGLCVSFVRDIRRDPMITTSSAARSPDASGVS